jgi:hypothetical protein
VTSGFGAGMSFGLPCGAPWSTQFTIVSICWSVSDMSFLNFWTPTPWSICHGGIWRDATRVLIDRANGRTSSKVMSDIGAIDSG